MYLQQYNLYVPIITYESTHDNLATTYKNLIQIVPDDSSQAMVTSIIEINKFKIQETYL